MKILGPKWAAAGGGAALAVAIALGVYYEGGMPSHAYRDLGGVWTICAGHTAGVQAGDVATEDQCKAYLQQDMGTAYAAVQRCITTPLTIGALAAFTDLAYNAGPGAVCGSTLQRLANAGDVAAACMEINRWNKFGGAVVQGLANRRADEYALCISGLR